MSGSQNKGNPLAGGGGGPSGPQTPGPIMPITPPASGVGLTITQAGMFYRTAAVSATATLTRGGLTIPLGTLQQFDVSAGDIVTMTYGASTPTVYLVVSAYE